MSTCYTVHVGVSILKLQSCYRILTLPCCNLLPNTLSSALHIWPLVPVLWQYVSPQNQSLPIITINTCVIENLSTLLNTKPNVFILWGYCYSDNIAYLIRQNIPNSITRKQYKFPVFFNSSVFYVRATTYNLKQNSDWNSLLLFRFYLYLTALPANVIYN